MLITDIPWPYTSPSGLQFYVSYATGAGWEYGQSGITPMAGYQTDIVPANGYISLEVMMASLVYQDWPSSMRNYAEAAAAAVDLQTDWDAYSKSLFKPRNYSVHGSYATYTFPGNTRKLSSRLQQASQYVYQYGVANMALVSFAKVQVAHPFSSWISGGGQTSELRMVYFCDGKCAIYTFDPHLGGSLLRVTAEDGSCVADEVQVYPAEPQQPHTGTYVLIFADGDPVAANINTIETILTDPNYSSICPAQWILTAVPQVGGVIVLKTES